MIATLVKSFTAATINLDTLINDDAVDDFHNTESFAVVCCPTAISSAFFSWPSLTTSASKLK
jgi:hypothetical protein